MDTVSDLPRINTPKISDAAYDILREKIISRQFAAGQRLVLDTIEKQLGISRTTLWRKIRELGIE